MQWFYFAVANTHRSDAKPGSTSRVKFNIVNLTKPDSLFNQGLQPVIFNCGEAKRTGQGWVRCGSDIAYYANTYQRNVSGSGGPSSGEGVSTYFTLTFTIDFPSAGESYLLAHSYPYTYSDHKAHMAKLLSSPFVRQHCTHSVLCKTLGGNDCDLLTITEDGKDEMPTELLNERIKNTSGNSTVGPTKRKKCIVVTGRVHPGETQASWMMKGMLDFLTGNSSQARLLRSYFVFKIVPMLNPDGVAFGNNRCGLAGVDLNRQWKKPSRTLHPTVYFTKV